MASVNFTPIGSQLDSDSIADIALNSGDLFKINFILDTSDLDANLQFLKLQVDRDFAEVGLSAVRTDFDRSTFPDFALVDTNFGENFASAVFERNGDPGAIPDTVNFFIVGEITALDGLTNDGIADIGVTVLEAIDADGDDVTELFAPMQQAIDLQPLPTFSIDIEPSFAVEGGEDYTVNFSLSEPAPPGGLPVRVEIIDPDAEGDSIANFAEVVNIENAEITIENGRVFVDFIFTEGETLASLDFTAPEDNREEGNEIFSLVLLPGDGYNVDVDRNKVTSLIADADLVIDGTAGDDLIDGTSETDTILGKAGNDVIVGNGGADALFGERGNDVLQGGMADDFINGGKGKDRLFGDGGNDFLLGEEGRDRLLGEAGSDTLEGGNGRDTLIGGSDSDILIGGRGSDRLVGVDLSSSTPGSGEIDTLIGGSGRDTFVLGNETGIFYDDGDITSFGESDFALITDLNTAKDRLQLFGFAEQYSLDFLPNNVGTVDALLTYDSGLDSGAELIARLENVTTNLNISDAAFTFI